MFEERINGDFVLYCHGMDNAEGIGDHYFCFKINLILAQAGEARFGMNIILKWNMSCPMLLFQKYKVT